MRQTPINSEIVFSKVKDSKLASVGKATIRELVRLVNEIEVASGEKFVRMEMGVPGLEPADIGIEAEIKALRRGVASKYPMIDGIPPLKKKLRDL